MDVKLSRDQTKIIFVGRAGVGKTTLRKLFFDRENPLILLKNSLEPTIGAETRLYDVGLKLAVHDLAGQELNNWLTTDQYVFDSSDIVFIILDASDDWEDNMEIVNKINEILKNADSKPFTAIFFHKMDLLTKMQQDRLELKIDDLVQQLGKNFEICMTSILENYIVKTFWTFINVLKTALQRKNNALFHTYLVKLELVKHFAIKKKLEVDKLSKFLHISETEVRNYLNELHDDGTLLFNLTTNEVSLDKRGIQTLRQLKSNIKPHLREILMAEGDYIRGVILSEKRGNTFFMYEHTPDFFSTLVTSNTTSSDPELISMFFSEIISYGKTMDFNGLNSFQFSGYNLKIATFYEKPIMGIFFLDRIELDPAILKSLENFLKRTIDKYQDIFSQYLDTKDLKTIEPIAGEIQKDILDLDLILKSHHQNSTQFTKRELLDLYLSLSNQTRDKIPINDLKRLLFHYLIMETPESLNEV